MATFTDDRSAYMRRRDNLMRRARAQRKSMGIQHWTRREQHEFTDRLMAWSSGFTDGLLRQLIRMYDNELER